jgi:hypothetical protein
VNNESNMAVKKAVMSSYKLLHQYLREGNKKTKRSTDFWADIWTENLSKTKQNG